jgi:DUF3037 family protein
MPEVVYYSLVQVVPDLIRGERMNVGVVVWDAKNAQGATRFTKQRQRLRALGLVDLSFLREFELWLNAALSMPGQELFASPGRPEEPWSLKEMQRAASDWGGMLQLSEPHPSRGESAAEVADEVYDRAVHLRAPLTDSDAGKKAIRRSVATTVRNALKRRFGETPPVTVRVTHEVAGTVDSHVFDVVLSNGDPRSVLVTPNLRDPRTTEVRRDLDAAAWSVQDVSNMSPEIRFGLVRDPGARPVLLNHVDALVASLPLEPIERERLSEWATTAAENELTNSGSEGATAGQRNRRGRAQGRSARGVNSPRANH